MDGKQTPPPPPPPAPNIPNYIFTPTFPPATTLPPPQLHPNIDWDILLSCPNRPNYNIVETHPTTLDSDYVALTSQSGITNIDDDDGGRRRRSNGGRVRRASSRTPRFEFQTRSEDDVLDDGYRWRKYGQKSVKNTIHPRSYYRCTHHTCNVKKQVQRLAEDNTIVVTTYDGIHNHPSEKLMETLTPLLNQMQFLSNFT